MNSLFVYICAFLFVLSPVFSQDCIRTQLGSFSERINFIETKEADFNVNPELIKDGSVQICTFAESGKDFLKKREGSSKIQSLDSMNLLGKFPKELFIFNKVAYMVKGKTPDFFTKDLYLDPNFQESGLRNVKVTRKGANTLSMDKTLSVLAHDFHFLFDLEVEGFNESDCKNPNGGLLGQIVSSDVNLGTPSSVIVVKTGSEKDKRILGVESIAKYYKVNGDSSLAVVYQLTSADSPFPMFMVKGESKKQATRAAEFNIDAIRKR